MKALAYYVMKKDNPNMSITDTQIEIQKGLGSKKYLSSMMNYLTSNGGSDDFKMQNIAQAFGLQNNMSAVKELYTGYKSGKLGEIQSGLLKGTGEFSTETANKLGEEQTSIYSKHTADIQNAFIKSSLEGIDMVSKSMKSLFGTMITGLEEYIRNQLLGLNGKPQPVENPTKKPIPGTTVGHEPKM